jgi:UDP-N-acetylmuramoyl-tripeptide--D-alanyl-D-alanine ligase
MASIPQLYQHYLKHRTVCTDTRAIAPGCLFFALKGDHFDANTFAEKALAEGAAFAIIDNVKFKLNDRCILVSDVLTTLQELAKYHRNQLKIPVIGLTGSNGKTTTKELIRAVLAQRYQTFATHGNLNNHIGVPLSILAIPENTEIAVIEMGANHQKEIEFLCEIAQPTHGLISNVGLAHLDGFGGFEGVKKGKGELFTYLKQHNGFTFVNKDNVFLQEMSAVANLTNPIYYGSDPNNFVSGKLIHSDPFIELEWSDKKENHLAKANLTGTYNLENILAAICIARFFEVAAEQINRGLANYFPNNNRSQLTKTDKNTIICDFYNANPSSMVAALNNLKALTATHKIAILGDMFELGGESQEQHQKIVSLAASCNFEQTIFIGEHFYKCAGHDGQFFRTTAEAQKFIAEQDFKDALILLKGSRGMKLELLLRDL